MKKNMPYPSERPMRQPSKDEFISRGKQGDFYQRGGSPYRDPRLNPQTYARQRDPRPERRIFPDDPNFAPARHARREKRGLLALLLALLLMAGLIAGGYFFLKNRSATFMSNEPSREIALRESTNRYRVASKKAQNATLKMYQGLSGFFDLFIGTDQIDFHEEKEIPFISNDMDYVNEEPSWGEFNTKLVNRGLISYFFPDPPPEMGRLVIPKIGVNGRLCIAGDVNSLDLATKAGMGIVDYGHEVRPMSDLDEEGQTNILGHRMLNRTNGLMYLNEMEPNDSFYIDDYRSGIRYYYRVMHTELLVGEELGKQYNIDPETALNFELFRRTFNADVIDADNLEYDLYDPPVEGNSVLLVVCDPPIFFNSDNRILVWGKVIDTGDIPEDDVHFKRYKGENPVAIEAEE